MKSRVRIGHLENVLRERAQTMFVATVPPALPTPDRMKFAADLSSIGSDVIVFSGDSWKVEMLAERPFRSRFRKRAR